jgi:hypothetical protein
MTRSVKAVIAAVQILVSAIPVGLHAREYATRASARTTVNQNANVNRNVNVNRSVNVNQNVNVNRNLNVNVNRSYYGGYGGCCYHPVATAAAVTAAAVTTAAVVARSFTRCHHRAPRSSSTT